MHFPEQGVVTQEEEVLVLKEALALPYLEVLVQRAVMIQGLNCMRTRGLLLYR
jgi:hypothetical protein